MSNDSFSSIFSSFFFPSSFFFLLLFVFFLSISFFFPCIFFLLSVHLLSSIFFLLSIYVFQDHIKHIVKSNFVIMQLVNMSAYIQSQISTFSAQSGFYEGHMVSVSLGGIRCLCIQYSYNSRNGSKQHSSQFCRDQS